MRASLLDPQLEQQLRDDGYVVVDLLDDAALAELRGFWAGLNAGAGDAAAIDNSVSVVARPRVDEQVRAVLAARLDGLFDRHRLVIASLEARSSELDADEDADELSWSMVDETSTVSCGVWAPLTDADRPPWLEVVRGSHAMVRAVRGTPELPAAHDLAAIAGGFDPSERVTVAVRAGQAVIFDHRLLHSFKSAADGTERAAATVAMVAREARLLHHHLHPDGRVERFAVDDRFYLDVDPSTAPVDELSLGYVARELPWARPVDSAKAGASQEASVADDGQRRVTFADADLQAAFEQDGYVKVPLVSGAELARLEEIFAEIGLADSTGFHASIYSGDQDYKRAADAAIKTVLEPAYDRLLVDHRSMFANFLVKAPDDDSTVGVHQDWTFVDEDSYVSVNVWCPLSDTDEVNGTLRVVPGSHRCVVNLRGTPIDTFPSPFAGLYDAIMDRDSIAVSVRAGEAIIADTRLVHASAPNRSDRMRVVAGIGAAPSEAEKRHVYRDPSGTLELYRVDDADFFNRLVLGERPDLELVGTFPDVDKMVTQKDLDGALGRRFPAEPPSGESAPNPHRATVGQPVAVQPTDPGDPPAEYVTPEPSCEATASAPVQIPRLRRRLWNLLNSPNRQRAYALWRRIPGPLRRRVGTR